MKRGVSSTVAALLALTVALSLIVSCASQAAPAAKPTAPAGASEKILKVGATITLSGPGGAWGEIMKPQMQAYADLINEAGGLKIGNDSYKVQMYWGDDQYTGDGASLAAKQLVYNDKVKFIVGHFAVQTAAITAVTEPEKVIYFDGTITPGWEASKHPYTFAGTPGPMLASAIGPALVSILGTKKMGAFFVESPGAEVALKTTADAVKAVGVDTLTQVTPAGKDYTPYLAKFQAAGVDTIIGTVPDMALVLKQSYEAGFKFRFAQSATLLDPAMFIETSGVEAAQGLLSDYPNPLTLKKAKVKPEMLAMAQKIADRMQATGRPIKYWGTFGYGLNHMAILFDALQQAGTLDTEKVQKVLWGGTFETFLGKYTLSGEKSYGGPIAVGSPLQLSKIEGKQEVYGGEADKPFSVP